MAGIYVHIPFCKKKCHYCDFHFSTSFNKKDNLIDGILGEIELQKNYLNKEIINTIYFGGGTPSILSVKEMMKIFDMLYRHFNVDINTEITLEANPDDLSKKKINSLKKTPINRFSIGVQSFQDADLIFMNRAHNSKDAKNSIKQVQDSGWKNITIDLIYGTPTLSNENWNDNIETAINLSVPHISAYNLTVEKNTPLDHFIKSKKCPPIDEEKSIQQFQHIMNTLQKANFIQYEISNFSKEGYFSKHNSNYWKGEKYLGLGPSAHSFNKKSRQWNVKNNNKYIKYINKKELCIEMEKITEIKKYNEYILTNLRTVWGINSKFVKHSFSSFLAKNFSFLIKKWIKSGHICKKNEILTLSEKGKFVVDAISSDLFYVE